MTDPKRERTNGKLDKLKQGQYDLQDELDQVATQKEKLAQQLNDNDEKQMNLFKVVEQLTEKVTKLEMQPLHTQGFMTSSVKMFLTLLVTYRAPFRSRQTLTLVSLVELSPLHPMNLTLINGVSMSSHTKLVTLMASYCLPSGNQLLVKPNQLSDIWDHHTL